MDIDFDAGVSNFCTVPGGRYRCRVAEVRPGTTRAGDVRWSLRLVITEGEHAGKQAAWDSIVFSTRGRARARMVLHALGLNTLGLVRVEPHDMEGREALIDVRPATYMAPNGLSVRRNEVPYDGYTPVSSVSPSGWAIGVRTRRGQRGKSTPSSLSIQANGAISGPVLHLKGTDGKTTFVTFPDAQSARDFANELLRVVAVHHTVP